MAEHSQSITGNHGARDVRSKLEVDGDASNVDESLCRVAYSRSANDVHHGRDETLTVRVVVAAHRVLVAAKAHIVSIHRPLMCVMDTPA